MKIISLFFLLSNLGKPTFDVMATRVIPLREFNNSTDAIIKLPNSLNFCLLPIYQYRPEHIYNSYYGNGVPAKFTS